MKKNSLLPKIIAVLVLIAIAVVMFIIGRGHSIYFDNKTLEVGSETFSPFYRCTVYVKGEKIGKLQPRDRGSSITIGQNFSFDLEIIAEKDGPTENKHFDIKLPYDLDGIVLNLPALVAGQPQDVYLTEFVSMATTVSEEEEEVVTDEFAMGDL